MNTTVAPQPVSAPCVWLGDELAAREDWIIRLKDEALGEIEAALARIKDRGIALKDVTSHDFSLPSMAHELPEIERLLSKGPGLCLLRGVPVDRYSREDIEIILWGIGTHVGAAITQSYRGDVIGEVMDMTHTGDTRRAYRSPLPLSFHIDSVDVTALLSLRRAKQGGMSLVASSFAIHNAILAERPDLMPALYRGYHCEHSEANDSGEDALTPPPYSRVRPGGR